LYGRASNAFNQVIEKDLDALMDRTKTSSYGRMSTFQHWLRAVLTIVGITLLYMINPKTAMFGAISFLYTSVYTPLKTVTSLSVFVGAFPSYSVYVRLGCCNRRFWDRSWNIIFNSIFLAIPHFGQLVGSCMKIMKRQVFMLPTGKKTRVPLCILYTGWLIIASLLPP
jgi:protoheme IX farnesyltransferase